MLTIVKSVYKLLGKCVNPPLTEDNYIEHTDAIFEKLDRNKDGLVTMEEFFESCSKVYITLSPIDGCNDGVKFFIT